MTDAFIKLLGWDELVRGHTKMITQLQPSAGFGMAIRDMALMGRSIAESKTHRVTSALSQSHRIKFSSSGIDNRGNPEAVVFVTPIRNPLSNIPTDEYAGIEDARGGDHAFYRIVVDEHGNLLFMAFAQPFARALGFA